MLIGVSHFPESPDLADLEAVRENVASLWRRLTDDTMGVLKSEHCAVVDPEGSTADIGRAISKAAAEASDMLLIYYAGHGLVDDRGRLYLATNATQSGAPKYSALGVDLLREDLGGSGAAARVLILDCCFSGRAIEVMAGEEGLVDGQLSIAGTYTMTSTSSNAPSYALAGERYTAFTGALLAALDSPRPLTLDEIYRCVATNLHSRGLPRPRQRATDSAASLALARGPVESDKPVDKRVNEVRFRRDHAAERPSKKTMQQCLGNAFLLGAGGPVLVAGLTHDTSWLWVSLVITGMLTLGAAIAIALQHVSVTEAELIIDRSGITVRWHLQHDRDTKTQHVPWTDVSHVGVLPPKRGSVYPSQTKIYEGNHLLVVRLRPDVPFHSTKGLLFSDKLHELGYRVIGSVGAFHANKEQVLAALDQFAGDCVLHTTQEFLARDPRIEPKMF
ncbi:caspase domain-containing protein [Streptomyces sp. NPDC056785]|uniref:caspase family protein n=1 Tax=Streptomyces sp. NPDC056785 TaxID=3345944 RepID=UPI0036CEFEBE